MKKVGEMGCRNEMEREVSRGERIIIIRRILELIEKGEGHIRGSFHLKNKSNLA